MAVVLRAQFAPPAGQPGTTAMHSDSSAFVAWATGCVVERGPQQIDKPDLGNAYYGADADAVGKADNIVVSLGDGGKAVLTFQSPICNEAGPDFAIFENSFNDTFLELAFVEVSSDGSNYFRLPAISLTPTDVQVDGFGSVDATKIHNLAGKYKAFFGTPFDLDDIEDDVLLDKNSITHVRIIDVVGNIDPEYATYDSEGHVVNDPWPTPFWSSGFDLDAVGVIHDVAHSNAIGDVTVREVKAFPSPVHDRLNITAPQGACCEVLNLTGQVVAAEKVTASNFYINMVDFESGVYVVKIIHKGEISVTKIVKQ